jgi:ribonuclease P protein component
VLAGKTLARSPHFALHTLAPSVALQTESGNAGVALFFPNAMYLGAMVPKRWAKRAVTRNAIKRQTLQPTAHLVRLRSTFDRAQFISATSDALKAAVRAELVQLFSSATTRRGPA